MKPDKAGRDEGLIDEIVETLKSVPKTRLRIVRDVVGALAEPAEPGTETAKMKRRGRKSLLKTPFCGMWEGTERYRQRSILRGEVEAEPGKSWRQNLELS